MSHVLTVVRLAASFGVLAGCGHDSGPPAGNRAAVTSTTTVSPCSYMARGDAETAVGQPLPLTAEQVPLGMCQYTTAEFYGASLTVTDWSGIKNAATRNGTMQPDAVIGVGDEALTKGGLLYVRKGERGFLLVLNGPHVDTLADKGLARAKTLALTILPKI